MYNPFSLESKIVFVTGASSGIGRGIAIGTSKMGAKVYISGRNENRLDETLSLMNGSSNVILPAELTNDKDINHLVEILPPLDGVVLCAGIIKTMPVKNITDSAIEEIFKVNIISEIQLLSRLLKKKKLNKKMVHSMRFELTTSRVRF